MHVVIFCSLHTVFRVYFNTCMHTCTCPNPPIYACCSQGITWNSLSGHAMSSIGLQYLKIVPWQLWLTDWKRIIVPQLCGWIFITCLSGQNSIIYWSLSFKQYLSTCSISLWTGMLAELDMDTVSQLLVSPEMLKLAVSRAKESYLKCNHVSPDGSVPHTEPNNNQTTDSDLGQKVYDKVQEVFPDHASHITGKPRQHFIFFSWNVTRIILWRKNVLLNMS